MNQQNNRHHENDDIDNRLRDLGSNQLKSVRYFKIYVTLLCVFVLFASIYTAYNNRNTSSLVDPSYAQSFKIISGKEPDSSGSDLPIILTDSIPTNANQSLPNSTISKPIEPIYFNNISDKQEDEISVEKISNIVEQKPETTGDRVNHENISEVNVINKVLEQVFIATDAKHALSEDNVDQLKSMLREIIDSQKRVEDYARQQTFIMQEWLKIERKRYFLDYTLVERSKADQNIY